MGGIGEPSLILLCKRYKVKKRLIQRVYKTMVSLQCQKVFFYGLIPVMSFFLI